MSAIMRDMEYISAAKAAKQLGVSKQAFTRRLHQGMVRGSQLVGNVWMVPVKALGRIQICAEYPKIRLRK